MKKAKILAERVSVDKTRAGDQRLTLTPNCINTISSTTSWERESGEFYLVVCWMGGVPLYLY
jgi:hypothetical protein